MNTVFLDRDGVINKYPGDRKYVTSLRKFRFLPRAKKAVAELTKNNFRVFVVSNQAGVGKGVYSQRTLDLITERMLSAVRKEGGRIDKVYYCTHRPEARCACRKPRAGMIRMAQKEHGIGLKGAYFVGDTIRDVLTAEAAGCKSILVTSGKEKLSNRKNWEAVPHFVFKDLHAAVRFITKRK